MFFLSFFALKINIEIISQFLPKTDNSYKREVIILHLQKSEKGGNHFTF